MFGPSFSPSASVGAAAGAGLGRPAAADQTPLTSQLCIGQDDRRRVWRRCRALPRLGGCRTRLDANRQRERGPGEVLSLEKSFNIMAGQVADLWRRIWAL